LIVAGTLGEWRGERQDEQGEEWKEEWIEETTDQQSQGIIIGGIAKSGLSDLLLPRIRFGFLDIMTKAMFGFLAIINTQAQYLKDKFGLQATGKEILGSLAIFVPQ
jgi:hypothetical protein